MSSSLLNFSKMIRPGLRKTAEERKASRKRYDAALAVAGAQERARYNAMTPEERAEYDALTEGMMPRLRRN